MYLWTLWYLHVCTGLCFYLNWPGPLTPITTLNQNAEPLLLNVLRGNSIRIEILSIRFKCIHQSTQTCYSGLYDCAIWPLCSYPAISCVLFAVESDKERITHHPLYKQKLGVRRDRNSSGYIGTVHFYVVCVCVVCCVICGVCGVLWVSVVCCVRCDLCCVICGVCVQCIVWFVVWCGVLCVVCCSWCSLTSWV